MGEEQPVLLHAQLCEAYPLPLVFATRRARGES